MNKINYITEMHIVEGKSISEIRRITGYSRDTIRKYLDKDYSIDIPKRRNTSKKTDPYIELIRKWLVEDLQAPRKQRHTAQRIYERLIEETNYDGKLRIVRACVSELRDEIYKDKIASLSLKRPLEEAQVDFGEVYYFDSKKVMQKGYELVLAFPSSNASYSQLLPAQNQECLFHGLKSIFSKINGVPKRMVFDNMSTAVVSINKDRTRTLTDEFLRFKLHYGFNAVFCNPGKGNEKPHAEINVGYLRRNLFVPMPEVDNFDDYNQELFTRCDKRMERMHYIHKVPIIELFKQNEKTLHRLPNYEFDIGKPIKRKTNKNSYVLYDKTYYSTLPNMVNHNIWIKPTYNKVIILDKNYDIIDIHERKYDQTREVVNWINYIPLIAKRPNALKYTGFYKSLPNIWKMHIEDFDYEELKSLLIEFGEELVKEPTNLNIALEKCISMNKVNIDYLKLMYRKVDDIEIEQMTLPEYVPNIRSYEINLNDYDSLFRGADHE